MTRRATAALGIALACGAAPAVAADAPHPTRVTVLARPGAADRVAHALGRGALRVLHRDGRRLEVAATPRRAAAIARVAGVASVGASPVAYADEVVGEGLARTGAAQVAEAADGGRGLTIAILDLGFGTGIAARQAAGELPSAVELASFDPVHGIAGTNAYGNPTNHGEIVAQTVYDYAPAARYVFASYHSEADFLAAVDWLVQRRPDIVVHSNSFIEGPFDGTGPEARAVDRAAAAGILWFNSAGNYALTHWAGPWADADGDDALDIPNGAVFSRAAGKPVTFAVNWPAPAGGPVTDLDIALERLGDDGLWTTVARSADAQTAGAAPAERIVGYLPPTAGTFRLRVTRAVGPPPAGPLTVFSREIPLADWGGAAAASIPTPGDADGSITVGAVDWRGNALKGYSSQGPTADGRLKPDLVAPTNTRVLGPSGPRAVGGTSNAAPNAAGVAAVILASQRAAGLAATPAGVRATLLGSALDLGLPGPDPVYGAGRVRAEVDPPVLGLADPVAGAAVRADIRLKPLIDDESDIARWAILVDGVALTDRRPPVGTVRLDTRGLPDGIHTVQVRASDLPGNAAAVDVPLEVDNTAPVLGVRRVQVVGPAVRGTRLAGERAASPRAARARAPRRVSVVVAARDAGRRPMRLVSTLTDRRGAIAATRTVTLRTSAGRILPLGRHRRGVYRLTLQLTDGAGNTTVRQRRIRVR
ncbi:MAG: S8 family serine peptidase [Actinomycetota bacterium]